ncbi:enoyl-CoA hydratase-related protein [Amycolatopsis acidiphila]|uniref:Enoyl-CoA hydratase/isomerase family protein n=1 Tax=Amycolatopsis acidiphila TaxID=715473 RepID=A0A558AHY6_9PSEU|nr:enoyl-CoA hydratase-related protein [Amycolatopsis acidiphila]TVT23884.1 hypothetical protein FNH06_08455 [Amycolatopsis acidiphila]UIJ61140.1 enoyl-CoA hydratase-related protein [Amycolatopsis acidiphila]GHG86477.1 hypothetical protein GCM10017788_59640 [Amycolatopsis acidiphila]
MLDLSYDDRAIVVRMRPAPALTAGLLESLLAAIAYVGPERAVVLTGTGAVFAPDLEPTAEAQQYLPRALAALRAHPVAIVAAINGDAVGAGYALAQAADTRIISGGVIRFAARSYTPSAAVAAGLAERSCAPEELIELALSR